MKFLTRSACAIALNRLRATVSVTIVELLFFLSSFHQCRVPHKFDHC